MSDIAHTMSRLEQLVAVLKSEVTCRKRGMKAYLREGKQ